MITRDLEAESFFKKTLEGNGYTVNGISFIETKEVKYTTCPQPDWVFFASSNAIDFFFQQNPELKAKVKFGVIVKSTEATLKKHNITE